MSHSLQNYGCCGCPSTAKANPGMMAWGDVAKTVLVGALAGGSAALISSGKPGMPQGELAQKSVVVTGAVIAAFAGYYFGKQSGMKASATDLAKATGIPDILQSVMG